MTLGLLLTLADAALKIALPALVTWFGALGTRWINSKTNSEKLSQAFLRLLDVVNTVVAEAQQTTVNGIKAAYADGHITKDELARTLEAAKRAAVDKVLQYLGPEYQKLLTEGLKINRETLANFIAARIEAAVLNLKSPGATNLPEFLKGPGVQAPVQPLPAFLSQPPTPPVMATESGFRWPATSTGKPPV
jgi:hypothetical protein